MLQPGHAPILERLLEAREQLRTALLRFRGVDQRQLHQLAADRVISAELQQCVGVDPLQLLVFGRGRDLGADLLQHRG